MRLRLAALVVLLAIPAALSACATPRRQGAERPLNPKASAFHNDGKQIYLGIDVRPFRLAPADQGLKPFQIAVVNKGLKQLDVSREGILLEGEDGRALALATEEEYLKSYGRTTLDAKAGEPFLETLQGRFPEPPWTWRDLEFFTPRTSASSPRDSISLRKGELAVGFVYFRTGELKPAASGRYKLVMKAKGLDPFVVEFPAQ